MKRATKKPEVESQSSPSRVPSAPVSKSSSQSPYLQTASPALRLNSTSPASGAKVPSQTAQSRPAAAESVAPVSAVASSKLESPPTFKVTSFAKSGSGDPTLTPGSTHLIITSPALSSSATVEASGEPSAIANWDIGYIQSTRMLKLAYTHQEVLQEFTPTSSVRDGVEPSLVPWYASHALAQAKVGAVTVKMYDRPEEPVFWAADPGMPTKHTLRKAVRRQLFKTWLVARHRINGTLLFLRRFSWLIDFVVKVDKDKAATNHGLGLKSGGVARGRGLVAPNLEAPLMNNLTKNPASYKITPLK